MNKMKKSLFYFLLIFFFASCSKEGGKLMWNMTYSLANESDMPVKKSISVNDRYTQYGDYITSITPTRFIAKFLDLRLCSTWENQNNNLEIIDNSKFPWTSTDRIADFSNSNSVNINVNGNIAKDMDMIYLVSTPMFYYQEFELPQQYYNFIIEDGIDDRIHFLKFLNFGGKNIDYPSANSGIGGIKEGCIIKGSDSPLMAPIFDDNWTGFNGNFPEAPHTTVFGNIDSTFIFHSSGKCKDDPMGLGGDIIRSNKFNPITLHGIPDGETKTVTGTMTFNTTDLIQIYAGEDNLPYTNDDIFVYAPRFWERLTVSLTSY
jgi:hypothetical protein